MASTIETKIDRIATAVTSALSALTAKGVTVPEGANVESLAALIEGIEAGGGGLKYIEGSFTLAEETTADFTIPIDCSPLMNDGEDASNFVLRNHCSIIIWADWDSIGFPDYGSIASYYIVHKSSGARVTGQVGFSGTNNPTYASSTYGILATNESLTYRFKSNTPYVGAAGTSFRYLVVRVY